MYWKHLKKLKFRFSTQLVISISLCLFELSLKNMFLLLSDIFLLLNYKNIYLFEISTVMLKIFRISYFKLLILIL